MNHREIEARSLDRFLHLSQQQSGKVMTVARAQPEIRKSETSSQITTKLNNDLRSYSNVRIDNETRLNLKKQFPISRMLVVKELAPWLLAFIALIVLYSFNFRSDAPPTINLPSAFSIPLPWHNSIGMYQFDSLILYGSTLSILTIVALYYEIQRIFFRYKIDGFRLVIRRGVIWVNEGSLPLSPITEVYLRRGIVDLILGLAQVNIAVPIDSVRSFARIDGLRLKKAHQLLEFLAAQLNQQVSSGDGTNNMHEAHRNTSTSFAPNQGQ